MAVEGLYYCTCL